MTAKPFIELRVPHNHIVRTSNIYAQTKIVFMWIISKLEFIFTIADAQTENLYEFIENTII